MKEIAQHNILGYKTIEKMKHKHLYEFLNFKGEKKPDKSKTH